METHTYVVIGVLVIMAAGLLPSAAGQVNPVIENPSPISAVFDESEGFRALDGADHVEVFEKGGRIYAIVTALGGDGVQIMDITNPAQPVPVSAVFDESEGFRALERAHDVKVFEKGGRIYAIVTAWDDDGVQIMDITNPTQPVPVSAVFDNFEGFSALDGAHGVEVFEKGGRIYAIVTAGDDDGVQIMDITNPMQPVPVSAVFDESEGFSALDAANYVEVFEKGGRMYAIVTAWDDDGVQIMDITNPIQPVPVSAVFDNFEGFSALDGANDVEVFEKGGRLYAIVTGRDDSGVQIMDITNPTQPVPVSAVFDESEGFSALDGANDVEVFEKGGQMYVIATGRDDNGVQIMDITNPTQPVPVSAVFDNFEEFSALDGANDVEVFEKGGRIYAIVTAWDDDGVQIMDITNPIQPVPVSAVFDNFEGFSALDGANDVEVFEKGERMYALVTAWVDDGVQIMDITNPTQPVPVSAVFDESEGFSALDAAKGVEVFEKGERMYAIVTAWYDNGVQIMDITNPTQPVPVSAVFDNFEGFSALDGANDVEVFEKGERMYAIVTAWYDNGVQIMDITNPTQPVPVSAVFDNFEGFSALDGANDVEVFEKGERMYALVTGRDDNGVQIMDITNPTQPVPVSAVFDNFEGFSALDGANDVEVFEKGGRIYAIVTAWYDNGLQIMDITNPMQPVPVSAVFDESEGFSALDAANDVEVFEKGGRIYAIVVAWDDDGVQIMDITNPMQPVPVSAVFDESGGFSALDAAKGVEVFEKGGRIYAIVTAWDDDGVQIMDITNPTQPVPVSAVFDNFEGFSALDAANDVGVFEKEERLYAIVIARYDNGVQIMDITNPTQPVPVSAVFDESEGFSALHGAYAVEVFEKGERMYAIVTARDNDGVQIMDITNPTQPVPVSAVFDNFEGFSALDGANDVEVFEKGERMYALVTAWYDNGLQIMDITNPTQPVPVSAVFDNFEGFSALDTANDVEVFEKGGRIYAIVTAWYDNGVQIMDITNPMQPVPVSAVFDESEGFSALDGANEVNVFEKEERTYAIVTSGFDNGVQIMDITPPVSDNLALLIRAIYDTTTARLVLLFSEPVIAVEPGNISLIHDVEDMQNGMATLADAELHTINGQSRSHTLAFSIGNQIHVNILEAVGSGDDILLTIGAGAIYIADGFTDILSYGNQQPPVFVDVEALQ